MGAVAYWGPKLWGRQLSGKAVGGLRRPGAARHGSRAFPYVIAGFLDQPLGAVDWEDLDGPIQACNVAVTAGFGLLTLTVVAFGLLALYGFARGETVGDDPWDAQTLEWAVPTPAVGRRVPDLGLVRSAEPLLDAKEAASSEAVPAKRRRRSLMLALPPAVAPGRRHSCSSELRSVSRGRRGRDGRPAGHVPGGERTRARHA